MAIEQDRDLVMGHGGGGHHAAEVVTHGSRCGGKKNRVRWRLRGGWESFA
jgi:hypothetical protein